MDRLLAIVDYFLGFLRVHHYNSFGNMTNHSLSVYAKINTLVQEKLLRKGQARVDDISTTVFRINYDSEFVKQVAEQVPEIDINNFCNLNE